MAHVAFAHPFCADLSRACWPRPARRPGATIHVGGTYVCIEGPQFSTRAESELYRSWGMDVIGMTNLQEAKLAREAEICYATLAMVTDYDCWHPDHDARDRRSRSSANLGAERGHGPGRAAGGGAPHAGHAARAASARSALRNALMTPADAGAGRRSSATSRPSSGSTCR